MKNIIVRTQKDLDSLPDSFKEFTLIEIRSEHAIRIDKDYGNSRVVAYGNSRVVAYGNSRVVARENSRVVARENSRVVAYGNSRVVAWGNSRVVAWGNSSVAARGNSRVVAFDYSFIIVFSTFVILKLLGFSTVSLRVKIKIKSKSKTSNVLNHIGKELNYSKKDFLSLCEKNSDGRYILYKSVNPETLCDFHTGKVKYENIVTCNDFDSNKNRECGGGLHLCHSPEIALSFNVGKVLKCLVHSKDMVIYKKNIAKIRCRKVEVLGPA